MGAGAVGGTLAVALAQAGSRGVAVASQTRASAAGLTHSPPAPHAPPPPPDVRDARGPLAASPRPPPRGLGASPPPWLASQGPVHTAALGRTHLCRRSKPFFCWTPRSSSSIMAPLG